MQIRRSFIAQSKPTICKRGKSRPDDCKGKKHNEVTVRCEGKPRWCWAIPIATIYPNELTDNDTQLVNEGLPAGTEAPAEFVQTVVDTFDGRIISE